MSCEIKRKLFLLIFLSVNSFFAWCVRNNTITIIRLLVGLLPLLRPTENAGEKPRKLSVKKMIDAACHVWGFGAFGFWFSTLRKSKKAEKMRFFDIVGAFLQCFKLYAFLMLWRCGVYSFVFYVVLVSCCVGVVIFWGVFGGWV